MTSRMITIFNYLLVFNVFGGAFTMFRQPFEFNLGYLFIIFFLIAYIWRYRSLCVNSSFIILLIILTILSLINVYFGNNTVFLLAKQVSGILITGVAYYLLVKINNYDINKLFKIYLQIALIVAAIGVFQELSFLVGFRMGYDYKWVPMMIKWECGHAGGALSRLLRINSIFMEPAHFAISMAPAFFASFLAIIKKSNLFLKARWANFVIIISYILTFSIIAYVAILISLLLFPHPKKKRYLLILAVTIPVLSFAVYNFIPDIRMRVDDGVKIINQLKMPPDTHESVYSVVSNSFVAFKSFMANPLFGHGLGSHPVSYDKFIRLGAPYGFWQADRPEVCKGDSGSLFLRLLSEIGLFGIAIAFYFIFRFRLKMGNNRKLEIISNGIFILFILYLLRQAHYFYNGLFFFVWVYYFAYKIHNKSGSGILAVEKS